MFCAKCGNELVDGAKFCSKCGTRIFFADVENLEDGYTTLSEESQSRSLENGFKEIGTGNKKKTVIPVVISLLIVTALVIVSISYYFTNNDKKNSEPEKSVVNGEDAQIKSSLAASNVAEKNDTESIIDNTEQIEDNQFVENDDIISGAEQEAEDINNNLTIGDTEYAALETLDTESEVLRIREVYNTIQNDCQNYDITNHDWGTFYDGGQYKKVLVRSGYNSIEFERWYFFENDTLFFSFYFVGSDEQRFYFYDSKLFRWKDNDITYDKEYEISGWKDWEDSIISESDMLLISEKNNYADIMRGLISVRASSTLHNEKQNYGVTNLIDNDQSTAWVEGVAGTGNNEYIVYRFGDETTFSGISIRNGYQKRDDLYNKNARVKVLRITDGNGNEQYVNVPDEDNLNNIDFYEPFTSDFVTVYIDSVYSGDAYEDTCISELTFY